MNRIDMESRMRVHKDRETLRSLRASKRGSGYGFSPKEPLPGFDEKALSQAFAGMRKIIQEKDARRVRTSPEAVIASVTPIRPDINLE